MKFPSRQHPSTACPGSPARSASDRRPGHVLRTAAVPATSRSSTTSTSTAASAEALLDTGVAAVVNASPFISGRYPNLGPELLAQRRGGARRRRRPGRLQPAQGRRAVRVHEGTVYVGDEPVVAGRELDRRGRPRADGRRPRAGSPPSCRASPTTPPSSCAASRTCCCTARASPSSAPGSTGRPVVVVVRGFDYREDLRRLRRFIREQRPVLVGVDAGADALLDGRPPPRPRGRRRGRARPGRRGRRPRQPVSDKALRGAREVLLHADRAGPRGRRRPARPARRPRADARRPAAPARTSRCWSPTSRGASLIVTVGTHATLDEFLDRQRCGLASTFLTRLRVGPEAGRRQERPPAVRRPGAAVAPRARAARRAASRSRSPSPPRRWGSWWPPTPRRSPTLLDWIQGLFT